VAQLRVFLSYHTPDRAIALGLKSAIEAALRGADVFVDQTHLRYGHLWQPALTEAIAKAQAFVILVSNRDGDWQRLEYYDARDRKAKDDAFVLLPVIIADRAKGPAANLPGLPQFHWIESTEPTAPDPLAMIVAALEARETAKPLEPWRAINPYRGLVALEEQDADFFFGRDRETAEILDKITAASGRLIALIGNSGVGKSSLVQAGVIGSLKRQRWPGGQHPWPEALSQSRAYAYLAMKPGEDPIEALMSEFAALWFPDPTDPRRVDRRREWAGRLRGGSARLADVIKATDDHLRNELALIPPPRVLVYIDQGEELYARAPAAERKRFSEIIADGLASSPQRLIILTSQRTDYYGELQANRVLFDFTEKIDVPPLKAENIFLVLREPARVLGVGFESDNLVSYIVKSAEDQPGALPLLADLFTDLWERMRERGDATLRVSDSREIVQVGAALSRRADQFIANATDKVEAVKRLFTLRLAHVPRQGEPVRARWERDVRPGADPSNDAEWALAEELAGPDWRLTVTGEKDGKVTAEVAHEILLKTWPTLQRWLEEEREFLIWRGELDARRKDYDKAGAAGLRQRRQALLMGLPLDTAKKWLDGRRRDIDRGDRAFIEASLQADRAATRNRQRLQTGTGALMLVVILGLVGWIEQSFIKDEWLWWTSHRWFVSANIWPYGLKPQAEQALKPGDTFRECTHRQQNADYCPDMVVVPAGSFIMGSSRDEKGHETDEQPRHSVTIAKPFAVSKFEVTFDEWDTCIRYCDCAQSISDRGFGRGKQPVINATWDDAQAYVKWLAKMTGKPYRLLTEAEFEYAARGGTQTAYPWGDDVGKNNANYKSDRPVQVGSFPANAFGLYDMVNNVWQWVEDCYQDGYEVEGQQGKVDAPGDGSAWTSGDCRRRAARGAGWDNVPEFLRSAHRGSDAPAVQFSDLGFRVGRTLLAP